MSKNTETSALLSRNCIVSIAAAGMSARPRKAAARMADVSQPDVDMFRGQHLALAKQIVATESGPANVVIDEAESPLVWLARRRGRDGRPLIEPHQLQAGERLRADFTCACLMPRTTSNWTNPISSRGDDKNWAYSSHYTDTMIAARQRVHQALDVIGPEFSGLLLDVCCFLKRLEDVERERLWPARSAKVVLQLGLDRLARHYGYAAQVVGRAGTQMRRWHAKSATPTIDAAPMLAYDWL